MKKVILKVLKYFFIVIFVLFVSMVCLQRFSNNRISIARATESDIDARVSYYKPIVPKLLVYAVGSVKASETQSGTAKMWTSVNEDGEVGLNISTEV